MPEDENLLTPPPQSLHEQNKNYESGVRLDMLEVEAGKHFEADWADHAAIRREIAEVQRKADRLMTVLVGLLISSVTAAIALSLNVILGSLKN